LEARVKAGFGAFSAAVTDGTEKAPRMAAKLAYIRVRDMSCSEKSGI
jgi:hypothetical protein